LRKARFAKIKKHKGFSMGDLFLEARSLRRYTSAIKNTARMITIKVTPGMDGEMILLQYADDIRRHTIDAIEECIELDLDEAFSVEFIAEDGDVTEYLMDFVLKKENWMQFLADSIDPFIADENYEYLMKVRELMRKLAE